jgi:hypothetical protein
VWGAATVHKGNTIESFSFHAYSSGDLCATIQVRQLAGVRTDRVMTESPGELGDCSNGVLNKKNSYEPGSGKLQVVPTLYGWNHSIAALGMYTDFDVYGSKVPLEIIITYLPLRLRIYSKQT